MLKKIAKVMIGLSVVGAYCVAGAGDAETITIGQQALLALAVLAVFLPSFFIVIKR